MSNMTDECDWGWAGDIENWSFRIGSNRRKENWWEIFSFRDQLSHRYYAINAIRMEEKFSWKFQCGLIFVFIGNSKENFPPKCPEPMLGWPQNSEKKCEEPKMDGKTWLLFSQRACFFFRKLCLLNRNDLQHSWDDFSSRKTTFKMTGLPVCCSSLARPIN